MKEGPNAICVRAFLVSFKYVEKLYTKSCSVYNIIKMINFYGVETKDVRIETKSRNNFAINAR